MLSCEPGLVALPEATEEADLRESQVFKTSLGQRRENRKIGPLEYLPGMHEALVSISSILTKQIYLYI